MKVFKAVIPVAGLSTRFQPATKAIAKKMLLIIEPGKDFRAYLKEVIISL